MAYEHSNTGQISSDLNLTCLLVQKDGTPIGDIFVLKESKDLYLSQLAEHIKQRRPDMLSGVYSDDIKFWRPDPPLSALPSRLLSAVNALRFNQPEGEGGVTELSRAARLRAVFTANQLQEDQVHVIAQLPLDVPAQIPFDRKGKGSDICIVLY
jgi:hypothetical protein